MFVVRMILHSSSSFSEHRGVVPQFTWTLSEIKFSSSMCKKNTASGTTAKRSTSSTPRVPQQVPGVPDHADGASNADEASNVDGASPDQGQDRASTPERGPNSGAPVQTDPLPSTRFSSLVLLFSKILDLLQREQHGHEDSSLTRYQVAQGAAALNVLSSGENLSTTCTDKTASNSHRRLGENLSTAWINQGPGWTSIFQSRP